MEQFHRNPEPLLLMLVQDDIMGVWSAKVDGQRRMKIAVEELAKCHKAATEIAEVMVKAGAGPDNAPIWNLWDVGRDTGSSAQLPPPPPPPQAAAAAAAAATSALHGDGEGGAEDGGEGGEVCGGYVDVCDPPLGAAIHAPGWLHTTTKKSAAEELLAGNTTGTFLVRIAKSKKRTPNEYCVLSVVFLKKCYHVEVALDADGCIKLEGKGGIGKLDAKTIKVTTLSEIVEYMSATEFADASGNAWKIKLGSGVEHDGSLMAPKWRPPKANSGGGSSGGAGAGAGAGAGSEGDAAAVGNGGKGGGSSMDVRTLAKLFSDAKGRPNLDVDTAAMRSTRRKMPSTFARVCQGTCCDLHLGGVGDGTECTAHRPAEGNRAVRFTTDPDLDWFAAPLQVKYHKKQGFAVQFQATASTEGTDYDGLQGFLPLKEGQMVHVWNESGRSRAKLEVEDDFGRAWMEGWIGHGRDSASTCVQLPSSNGCGSINQSIDRSQSAWRSSSSGCSIGRHHPQGLLQLHLQISHALGD